jgi:hypothetical protein
MFTTDPTIIDLKIKERNLYKAIFSMNFHQVATPELGVDEARCYIFFFREGDKLAAYIVLYMPNTGRKVHYSYSSNPFPLTDLPLVEDLARAFGEDMGFFLDEKSFASSSAAEKNLWIDEQPLFEVKAAEIAETAAAPEEEETPVHVIDDDADEAIYDAPPSRPETQSTPAAAIPPPMPVAPVYQQMPAQPAPPTTAPSAPAYQPAPWAPPAQSAPGAPVYYQPAPPVPPAPPAPGAPVYYQPAPPVSPAQPVPEAPVYNQPAQPAPGVPVYNQPAPPAPPAQPMPGTPRHYRPAPPAPVSQPAPAAPAPSPAAQTGYHQAAEVEPQVEVEVEVAPPPQRQKGPAVPQPATEKGRTVGAAPRQASPVQPSPPEREPAAVPKAHTLKQPVKKEARGATSVVGREMEALARLMASF